MLCGHVFLHVPALSKGPAADIARIRPLSCVYPDVIVQRLPPSKRFVTVSAFVLANVRVYEPMLIENSCRHKGLVTNIAVKSPFFGVFSPDVILQVLFCVEPRGIAHVALQVTLAVMEVVVIPQMAVRGELFAALFACVWHFPCVLPHMSGKKPLFCKFHLTYVTFVVNLKKNIGSVSCIQDSNK